jgi:hypothetical protein
VRNRRIIIIIIILAAAVIIISLTPSAKSDAWRQNDVKEAFASSFSSATCARLAFGSSRPMCRVLSNCYSSVLFRTQLALFCNQYIDFSVAIFQIEEQSMPLA